MDRKESLNKETDSRSKGSGISEKVFGIIKFILGLALLPFVYSVSTAFLGEIGAIEKLYQNYFWAGVASLIIIYLLIWEPAIIYAKGHRLVELVFAFFKPLVRVAPFLLPIYTILLFILYGLLSLAIKSDWLLEYSLFLFGATIILHLIFSAKTVRSKKDDFLKANYIFGFSFIYILNIGLLALGLSLIFKGFSFINFSHTAYSLAKNIFHIVFKQLFLR
jgi:hypothetical protein